MFKRKKSPSILLEISESNLKRTQKPNQMPRRKVSVSQSQAAKLKAIELKHTKAIHFMKACLKYNRKLNTKQQLVLQSAIQKIKKEITTLWKVEHELLMEKDSFRASSIRSRQTLNILDELEQQVRTLEKQGLVEKGFTVKAVFGQKK